MANHKTKKGIHVQRSKKLTLSAVAAMEMVEVHIIINCIVGALKQHH